MSELPAPETVRERAIAAADGDGVNLLASPLDGSDPLADVEIRPAPDSSRADGTIEYVGPDAARAGLLAAAATVAAERDARLHYPSLDLTAAGPWLVLEPLAGRAATVARGRADVLVEVDRSDGGVHRRLATDRDRLSALLEAALPRHDHYPVEDDDRGVFTAGMDAFSLSEVTVDAETSTVALEVETTPATTPAAIRERFEGCEGVRSVRLEGSVGVRRTTPSPTLRAAVERAQVRTLGDCEYAWVPPDAPLTAVPSAETMALGTGTRGDPFDSEQFSTCVRLLERSLDALEGSP